MRRALLTLTDLDGAVLAEESLDLGRKLMLGRGREATIRVRGDLISREHLKVEFDIDGLFVCDVSRNGSFLNGERLEENVRTAVAPGATVRLGKDRLLSYALMGENQALTLDDLPAALHPFAEQYTFLSEIERNARRRTFLARHTLMRRTVLVEMPSEQLEPGSDEEQRFSREARLFSRLDSPFLLKMYDFRVSEGRPVRLLERPEGQTAAERLKQGILPVADVLRLSADLAGALDALFEAGVVHRDVHPESIFLSPAGRAKLGSFGIATSEDETSITTTGVVLGRLGHTSPEQLADPRQADHRSDTYALGATLYHLLAGEPPLTPLQVAKGEWTPTPLAERRAGCPPELSDWIQCALARDPAARPQTSAEVRATLEALRDTHVPRPATGKFDPALLETQADDD